MNEEIYRKQALERFASPEHLDRLMPITRPRAWLALAGAGVLLVAAFLWSILARIENTLSGYGTLVRSDGVAIVRAPQSGTLANLAFAVDDQVARSQRLAYLIPAEPAGAKSLPIVSPAAGRIVDIRARSDQQLDAAQAILTIESPQRPLSAILFVPATEGYRVRRGMPARILPATADGGEAGFLAGHVAEAGRTPVAATTPDASAMPAGGAILQVIVALESPTATAEIFSGMPCQGQITIGTWRPIDFIFAGAGR